MASKQRELERAERKRLTLENKERRAQECDVKRAAGEHNFFCGYCKRTRGPNAVTGDHGPNLRPLLRNL
jgi:hypothetical protein